MKNVLNLNSHKYNYNKATRWLVRDNYYFKYNYELFKKIIINKKQETLNTTLSSMSKELNKLNNIRDDFGRIMNRNEKVNYIIYGNRKDKKISRDNTKNDNIMFSPKIKEEETPIQLDKIDFSNKLFEMSYISKYLKLDRIILTDFKPNSTFFIHDKELTLKSLLIRFNCMRQKEKYFEKDLLKHLFKNENNIFEVIKNAQMNIANERAKFDFNETEYLEKIKRFYPINGEMSDQAKLDIDMMIFEDMKFERQADVKVEPTDMFPVFADRVYSKSLIVNNYIINKMYSYLKNQDIFIDRKKTFYISLKSHQPLITFNKKLVKKELIKRIIDNDDLRYTKMNSVDETVKVNDLKNFEFYEDITYDALNSKNDILLTTKIDRSNVKKEALKKMIEEIKIEVIKNQEEIHVNHLSNLNKGSNKSKDPVIYNIVSSRLFSLEKEIVIRLMKSLSEVDEAIKFNFGYNKSIIASLFSNFDLLRRSSRLSENIHDRCHFGIVYMNGFAILTNYTRPYYGLVENNPLCVNASKVYNLNLNSERNFYNVEDVKEFAKILHIINYSEPREIDELKSIQNSLGK